MNNKLESVKCRCGGEAKVEYWAGRWYVRCRNANCLISTKNCDTEAEAITAWNKVMGERTAKVVSIEKPIIGDAEGKIIKVTSCGNCKSAVSIFDNYCPICGARLEWE